MSLAHMDWLMKQEQAKYELAADLEREAELGREHVLGHDGPNWPFYADPQWQVQEPEIFSGVLLQGAPL